MPRPNQQNQHRHTKTQNRSSWTVPSASVNVCRACDWSVKRSAFHDDVWRSKRDGTLTWRNQDRFMQLRCRHSSRWNWRKKEELLVATRFSHPIDVLERVKLKFLQLSEFYTIFRLRNWTIMEKEAGWKRETTWLI